MAASLARLPDVFPCGLDRFVVFIFITSIALAQDSRPLVKRSHFLGQGGKAQSLVLVEFSRDVDRAAIDGIIAELALRVREHPDLLPHHALVEASREQWSKLAGEDGVAYILPASETLLRGHRTRACSGAVTMNALGRSSLESVGDGWDGPGRGAARILYSFEPGPSRLTLGTVESDIARAMQQWSNIVQVDFVRGGSATHNGHINVRFAKGDHGDPFPFDGPGRILAHTFYPPPNPEPIAGDMHFDDDEDWDRGGVDFYGVALHEVGHSLSLGHSDDPQSVMYPYYQRLSVLSAADMKAAQALYASRSDPPIAAVVPSDAVSPKLLFPSADSSLMRSVVSFGWSAVAGALYYDLRLSDAANSEFRVSVAVPATGTVYTLASGTYLWQVRACNIGGCGPPAIRRFFVISSPLGGPPNSLACKVENDAGQNRLRCQWSSVVGAHFYEVAVIQDRIGPGGSPLTVAGVYVDSAASSLLVPNGTSSVVVRGCTGDGCGPWSKPFPVSAPFKNPAVPILSEPVSGAVIDGGVGPPQVRFSWNRVQGDDGTNTVYRLYVQDFLRDAPALDVFTTSNYYSAHVSAGTRFDAVVVALSSNGRATLGTPSAFVSRGRQPLSPVVVEPTSGSVVASNQGKLRISWTPVFRDGTFAPSYQYYVNTPRPVTGTVENAFAIVALPKGTWVVAVRACFAASACGPSSSSWGPWNNEAGSEGGPGHFTVK